MAGVLADINLCGKAISLCRFGFHRFHRYERIDWALSFGKTIFALEPHLSIDGNGACFFNYGSQSSRGYVS